MFPTPVGMNRAADMAAACRLDVPHTRGDEPEAEGIRGGEQLCSPHPWG